MTKRWPVVLSEIALLSTLTLWSGWGALRNPFHFDDALFLQNAQVTQPSGPFFLIQPTQSRQLTYLTFYWSYRVSGTNPFGYHLTNLLLHLANVFGVYLFASGLLAVAPDAPTGCVWPWIPLVAAALFAVHPIQSEVVNYAYQRSTLLAAFFSLCSMNSYLLYRRAQRPRILAAVSVAAFVLAFASKESALVLPGVWACYLWVHTDNWRSFRAQLSDSWRTWVPLAAAMVLGLTWFLYNLDRSDDRTIGLPLTRESFRYLLGQAQVLATYLRMLVWPAGLSVDHDFRVAPLVSLRSILCIALLAAIPVALYRLKRVFPTPCFLGGSFLILLSPTSSLVPSVDLLFEHRLYLPMIAGSVLLAWIGALLVLGRTSFGRLRRAAWIACVVVVVATCALLFRERTWVWGDNIRLWEGAVSKAPWNARAHYNLGVSLLGADSARAETEFLRVVELEPGNSAALYNLGWLAQKAGCLEDAIEYYRKTLKADPLHWQAHHNLGNLSVLRGSLPGAVREYRDVIRIRPDYWPAYQSLATVQLQLGEFKEALETLKTLREFQPDSLEVRYLCAYALVAEGNMTEAERDLGFVAERDKDGAYCERLEELRAWMGRR